MRYSAKSSYGYYGMIAHVAERLWHERPERRLSWESFTLDWVLAGSLPEPETLEYKNWIVSRNLWVRDLNSYFRRASYPCELTVDRDRGVRFRSGRDMAIVAIIKQGQETGSQYRRQYLINTQRALCAYTEDEKSLFIERNIILENGANFLIGVLRTAESQQAQLESERLAKTVMRTRRKARMIEDRQRVLGILD